MAKEPSIRDAKTIIDEKIVEEKKPVPTSGFNATTVEQDLARARNHVQCLQQRLDQLGVEMNEIRKELETANKIKNALDAAKAQVMEIDRLKGLQNGNSG